MYKSIIVDDESSSIELLEHLIITQFPEIKISAKAQHIDDALKVIKEFNPDILFLDIQLEDEIVFDLLDKISFSEYQVIFVTAYENYAHKAFLYQALDYILKPIDLVSFKKSVKQALHRIEEKKFLWPS